MSANTQAVRDYLLGLQSRIIDAVEAEDGRPFITDAWQREPGGKLEGEGRTRLLEGGEVIER
ncbi:MAG: coproporphyrinogen III oxidase, partial [Rhizobiales bacterium]|nr:coproporphyrinogen III oxidase [Rhizobacter sp.]